MIQYVKTSNWEWIENNLLSNPDKSLVTNDWTYFFKQVGDCAGIFRMQNKRKNPITELMAYYHEGEY